VVFFQNDEDRGLFIERRIVRPGQARVLPGSGVDLDRFKPAPLDEGPPVFLLVARLLRDKGVLEFVKAARILRPILPVARFQLLGPIDEGNRTAISRSELDSWTKQGVVEYLGVTEDVRPFIAAATAIVLPSYREGLPRALVEGAAMARPLIAADAPGSRDIVEDGVNGYLCRVRDARSLAEAMKLLADLPFDQRLAMGEAARRKVQERFSEELVVRAYLDVIAGLEAGTAA
jgi:glycosyltransferase involved in cell wall biosynthesis